MTHEHTEEMMKHIKIYVFVFVALAVLTGVTVWASYLHVTKSWHIAIALFIAAIKAGLVAAFFMHLVTERRGIFVVLILTVVFFSALLVLTLFSDITMLRSSFH